MRVRDVGQTIKKEKLDHDEKTNIDIKRFIVNFIKQIYPILIIIVGFYSTFFLGSVIYFGTAILLVLIILSAWVIKSKSKPKEFTTFQLFILVFGFLIVICYSIYGLFIETPIVNAEFDIQLFFMQLEIGFFIILSAGVYAIIYRSKHN